MQQKRCLKDLLLRIFAGGVMIMLLCFFAVMALFVTRDLHAKNNAYAQNGYLQLTDTMGIAAPVYLNGQWEMLPGHGLPTNGPSQAANYVDFPLGSVAQAGQDAAYRLHFSTPAASSAPLFLTVPTFQGNLDVYLNGILQSPMPEQLWLPDSSIRLLVPLENLDPTAQWQELVITSDFSNQPITLFQRPVLVGTIHDIATLTTYDGFAEVLAFGVLILIIANGCIFMLIRPNHRIISLLTLFDAIILARVFFSLKFTMGFVGIIFPGLIISDAFCRSAQLFFLMMGGILGCLLAGMIYDPQRTVPRWLTWPAPIAYGLFAIIFTFNMPLFERYGSIALIVVYAYTFVAVVAQFMVAWRAGNQRRYFVFQFARTVYIGLVVFWDIMFWTRYKDFPSLLYAYIVFFIFHLVLRLYDNNLSYHNAEVLNHHLEATVEERTRELSKANQILSELSIRDPLTNIFNRIHFEKTMEDALAHRYDHQRSLHLCIFDLDFFKNVNDTYGHHIGDEVLKHSAATVQQLIGDTAVLARIGGEEFVLLFDGYDQAQVLAHVEAVRAALAACAKANPQYTTASFGIAAWQAGYTQKMLLKAADKALYQAKNAGRNRIVIAEE